MFFEFIRLLRERGNHKLWSSTFAMQKHPTDGGFLATASMAYQYSAEDTAPVRRTALPRQSVDQENVKGIFSSGRGWDFAIVLCELATLGYGVEYTLVNSKDYGVPQSKERVYMIGNLTSCAAKICGC